MVQMVESPSGWVGLSGQKTKLDTISHSTRHTFGIRSVKFLHSLSCVFIGLVGDVCRTIRTAGSIIFELKLCDGPNLVEESLAKFNM